MYKRTLLVLLVLSLFASGGTSHYLEAIISRDTLVVGTAGEFPPFSVVNRDNELIGFDIDLVQMIADALGVTLKVVKIPFSDLLLALENHQIDIVASGMSITPQRNLKVQFIGPYFSSGKSLLTKEYNVGLSQSDASENSVVVVEATTSVDAAHALFKSSSIKIVQTFDEGMQLLLSGKVTAILADYPFCAVTAYRYKDQGISMPKAPFTYEPIGLAISHNAFHFANWLQNYLIILEGAGTLDSLNEKWFKDMSWVDKLTH